MYRERAFRIATRPHSEHSLRAIRSLLRREDVIVKMAGSSGDIEAFEVAAEWISVSAATVLATT